MRFSKRTRGFSLFELLVTLTILAILFSQGWPAWRSFFSRAQEQSLLAGLEAALRFARQEALARRESMTLCPSHGPDACGGSWQEGLRVFVEEEGGESQVIRFFQFSHASGQLYWRAFPHHRASCQFLPSGATNHENGTFWYCSGSQVAWALMLSQTGHWRVRYPDRNGKLNDERGLPLPC